MRTAYHVLYGRKRIEWGFTLIAPLPEVLRMAVQRRAEHDEPLPILAVRSAPICNRCGHAQCPACRTWCDSIVDSPDDPDEYDVCPCFDTGCDYGKPA